MLSGPLIGPRNGVFCTSPGPLTGHLYISTMGTMEFWF